MECTDKNKKNNLPEKLLNKDKIVQTEKSVQIHFSGKRQVLSSSPFNGGYREDLETVFNFDEIPECGPECKMRADTYEEHMKIISSELGLNPLKSAGLSTAVQMTSAVYRIEEYKGIKLEVIVTGGINVNGGRAGDTAYWDERTGCNDDVKPGTINIILAVNARLSEGAMTKAVITATEAKTAAIQELLLPSRYSDGLATGSGTDGIVIIGDKESDIYLTDAGQHSKLGELIGKAIIPALKESMYLQTGDSQKSQHNIFSRLERFGITFDKIKDSASDCFKRESSLIEERLREFAYKDKNVVIASLYAHLLDQYRWGLISEEETETGLTNILHIPELNVKSYSEEESAYHRFTDMYIKYVVNIICK